MHIRQLTTAVLLGFVLLSLGTLAAKSLRSIGSGDSRRTGDAVTGSLREKTPPENRVVVYYFHGSTRCPTCQTIEAYARWAITSGFAAEFSSGLIEWQVRNYEEPANASVVEKYQIVAPVVVLSKIDAGTETKWLSLDRVWQLTDDKGAFVAYVQQELKSLLR